MPKNKISAADLIAAAWRDRLTPTDGSPNEPADELLRAVQQYQSERLRATYTDFAQQAAYVRLTEFFLGELYGPFDFTRRNGRLHQLHDWLVRVTTAEQLEPMTRALALQQLSDELDTALTAILRQVGVEGTFSRLQYERAYRLSNNYDLRQVQIELLAECFDSLHRIVHRPLTGLQVKALQTPARALGWGSIADFVVHGYQAMKPIHDIRPFIQTVRVREREILERIYASAAEVG